MGFLCSHKNYRGFLCWKKEKKLYKSFTFDQFFLLLGVIWFANIRTRIRMSSYIMNPEASFLGYMVAVKWSSIWTTNL